MEWGISKQFGNSGETYFYTQILPTYVGTLPTDAETDTEDRNKPNFFQLVRFLSGYGHPYPDTGT